MPANNEQREVLGIFGFELKSKHTHSSDEGLGSDLIDVEDVRDAAAYEFSRHARPQARLWTIISRVFRRKRFWLAVLIFFFGGVTLYLKHIGFLSPQELMAVLKDYPSMAPIIFILIYSLMVVFLLPTLPLNLAAGFLWGGFWGTLLSVVAATIGACLAYLAARYLAGPYVRKKFNSRTWRWLRIEIKRNEWQVMAFTRLNPIFPFGPLNYFFGLTSVSFFKFIWTTVIFITPPSAMFSFIGASVGGFVMDQGSENMVKNVIAFSLAVTVMLVFRFLMKRINVLKK